MAKKNRKSEFSDETEIEASSKISDGSSPLDNDASEENRASVPEDLLDDVRRSLIEEESDKNKKETRWWRRLGRKEKTPEPEPSPSIVEIDLPTASSETEAVAAQTETDAYAEHINDLIDKLGAERQEPVAESSPMAAEVKIAPEPEPEIDLEQLKEQVFRPRSTAEEGQSDSDVRSIALEGGDEVFVEVEAPVADPLDERLKALENALRPYRRYIYMSFTVLGIVMAVMASLLIYNVYQQAKPKPVQEASNLPYPVAVSLPGGWRFNLGRGTLQGDTWEPSGAEWLEGTEVCRWVSLPWSRQLEAVLRTLNPKDPIELVMSNNDKLIYGVYSVYEMTPEEIQKVDTNSPCLLVILTRSDSEKRWVLTAVP